MGCSHSKLDDSEVVMRCKKRKQMMKRAVSHRKDFAVAHLAYLDALSKIGSALLHFAKENGILNEPPYTVESPPPSSTTLTTAATLPATTTTTTTTTTTSNTTANTNTMTSPLPLSSSHPSSSATSSSSFSPHQSDHQSSSPHHHHDDDDDDSCSSSLSPSPSPSPSPSYSSSPLSSHAGTPPSTPPPPVAPSTPLISPIEATPRSTPLPPSQPSSSSPQKLKSKPSPPRPRSRPPPTPSNHRASAASVDSDLPNSGFFSPAYSDVVVKEGGDGIFPAYSSSPPARPLSSGGISSPASPEQTSGWDYWNFFDHTIPYHHLHESITLDQPEEREVKEPSRKEDLELAREKEGIPDLEEEEEEHHHQQKQQRQQKQQQTQEGKEQKEEIKVEEKKEEQSAPPAKESVAEIVVEEVVEKLPVVPSVEAGESEKSPKDKKPAMVEKEEQASTDEKEVATEVKKKEEKKVVTNELAVVTTPKDKDLSEVLKLVSDQFALASAGGKDVSLLLETQRVHHHSSILDLRDSCQVLNVITFSWVSKISSISISKDLAAASDTTESGIEGSHALTLESLYAWEKKLYNEVKDGERLRILFDRKCKQLRSQDVRGEDQHIIDKTRATAKNLDSRLTVALRAVHCVSVRVQKLTNEELYPQLEEIIAGLMRMWRVMQECYRVQQQIAARMSDNMKMAITTTMAGGNELSDTHRRATMELESELNNWHDCHTRWLESQLHYVHTLFEWLRLCHLPSPEEEEVDLAKDPTMSPYWLQNSPICDLVTKWQDALHRLKKKDEAIDSISNFATVLHSLQVQQYEELQQKQRLLDLQRKETRMISYSHYDDSNSTRKRDDDNAPTRATVAEDRQLALSSFKSLLDEERKRHSQAVQERHYTTLTRFKENLPTLFQSMTDFAVAAFDEYKNLAREESSHSDDGEISDTSED